MNKLLSFHFLVPAVDRLSSLTVSTRLSPARSIQQTPDEVIRVTLGNSNHTGQTDDDFQIPVTNIDDILAGGSLDSDTDKHTKSSDDASQHTVTLSTEGSNQSPSQQEPRDCSILDLADETATSLSVEPSHVNQPKEVNGSSGGHPDAGSKCMYPAGVDSDSSSDSSVVVSKREGSSAFHESSSVEEEVELMFGDVQQHDTSSSSSGQNTNLTSAMSAEQPQQSSSCILNTASTDCRIDSPAESCDIKSFVASSPEIIPKNPFLSDSLSATLEPGVNLHEDASLTSYLLKHLKAQIPQSPAVESKTSGSKMDKSLTDMAESLPKRTSGLIPVDITDYPMRRGDLKIIIEPQSRPDTSAPKLKGLCMKRNTKPLEEPVQIPSESAGSVASIINASINWSTKLPTMTTISKPSNQLDMNGTTPSPQTSERTQAATDHGHLGGALQTGQLSEEKDPLSSTARSQDQDQELQPQATSTQRTFLEVQLSCISAASQTVVAHSETVYSKTDQRETDVALARVICPFNSMVEQVNGTVSNTVFSSLCSAKETHSTASACWKPSTTEKKSQLPKSSTSRLYVRTKEGQHLSTDPALSANYNPFSVQHKIQSFENLAHFNKPVAKSSDIQSYVLAHRASLNQRIAGYISLVNSIDCQTWQRSFSSYVDNLIPTTPCSPLLSKSPSSIALINLGLPHSSCSAEPLREDGPEAEAQEAPDGITPQVSQVLQRKHSRPPHNKLWQLRAVSMPELHRGLCIEDANRGHSAVGDKAESGVHPTRMKKSTAAESFPRPGALTPLDVNRVTQGNLQSSERSSPGDLESQAQQPSWSIRCDFAHPRYLIFEAH